MFIRRTLQNLQMTRISTLVRSCPDSSCLFKDLPFNSTLQANLNTTLILFPIVFLSEKFHAERLTHWEFWFGLSTFTLPILAVKWASYIACLFLCNHIIMNMLNLFEFAIYRVKLAYIIVTKIDKYVVEKVHIFPIKILRSAARTGARPYGLGRWRG